jgi:LAS superfamily LD-carboxypeptidase LdcB
MRKILVLIFLGISLNSGWAVEIQKDTLENEELTPQQPIEAVETTNPNKFTDLVKSTMDLLGPDLEISQATEVTDAIPE